jgi:predicted transcriptional regulator
MANDLLIRLDDDVTQRLTAAADALHRAPSEIVHSVILHTNALAAWSKASLDVWKEADFRFTISDDESQKRTWLYLIVTRTTLSFPPLVEADIRLLGEWINTTLRDTIDRWRVSSGDIKMSDLDFDEASAVLKKPRPKGIGQYHSGHSDTSRHVDEIVAEVLDERYPRHPKSP